MLYGKLSVSIKMIRPRNLYQITSIRLRDLDDRARRRQLFNASMRPTRDFSIPTPVSRLESSTYAGLTAFWVTLTGACYGDLISDGRVVQLSRFHNAHFGIRTDNTIEVGLCFAFLLLSRVELCGGFGRSDILLKFSA